MAATNYRKNKTAAKTVSDNTTTLEQAFTESETAKEKHIIPKDVDPTQYVVVRNGFQGRLVYKSRKTGETYVWDSFGDEQEMELRELRNAKNSYKKFFINNWFMFDEDWIVDYLGVKQYYKNAISVDSFDNLFTLTPVDIENKIALLSDGQKKSVAYRAKELISTQQIDSLKVIASLESALGIELTEK